jgi:penicillin-binding protein 2
LREITGDEKYRKIVLDGLVGVIYEEADYIAQHYTSLPVRVAGKSGTGERAGHNPTSWYITFAPVEDPKYLVAVTIEDATWANSSAIYANRDIWGALYGVPDTIGYAASSASMGD